MKLVLCGECYCVVPVTKWFGHRFWHQATIRMALLSSGFTEHAADKAAENAAEKIGFEDYLVNGL